VGIALLEKLQEAESGDGMMLGNMVDVGEEDASDDGDVELADDRLDVEKDDDDMDVVVGDRGVSSGMGTS